MKTEQDYLCEKLAGTLRARVDLPTIECSTDVNNTYKEYSSDYLSTLAALKLFGAPIVYSQEIHRLATVRDESLEEYLDRNNQGITK